MNFGSMNYLVSNKLVSGMPSIKAPEYICETCVAGKKPRQPFPKGKAWRAKRPLELVHSDLCSVDVPSNNGKKYFITFIDDFSRKTWVYFLTNKSEACETLKKFYFYVEKQSKYSLKTLRTDRGTEYLVCDEFLQKHGVKHQLTARYTPQQNGVAERKNMTIVDMVRCMIRAKNLPRWLWPEAVATAVYIQNRTPTKSVKGKTPYEAWYDKKPSVEHFKVFGCIAYAHNPDQTNSERSWMIKLRSVYSLSIVMRLRGTDCTTQSPRR